MTLFCYVFTHVCLYRTFDFDVTVMWHALADEKKECPVNITVLCCVWYNVK